VLPIAADPGLVQLKRAPADVPAFELGAPHPGTYPLDAMSLIFSF
jgi:hypothetical protein